MTETDIEITDRNLVEFSDVVSLVGPPFCVKCSGSLVCLVSVPPESYSVL